MEHMWVWFPSHLPWSSWPVELYQLRTHVKSLVAVQVVAEASLGGQSELLTGGHSYGEGRHPSLLMDDLSGSLVAIDLSTHLHTIQTIQPWGRSSVLVAGTHHSKGEAIVSVDLSTQTVSLWRDQASALAVLDAGVRAVVWTRGELDEPSMSLVDSRGAAVYTEARQATSSALDLYVDEQEGVYELSVMRRDWTIERVGQAGSAVLIPGLNTDGVTFTTATGSQTAELVLVRASAKLEAPLLATFGLTQLTQMSTGSD